MQAKRWLMIFFALFFIGIAGFMFLNYTMDPVDYFVVNKEADSFATNNYTRSIKARYLKKHASEYDAVLIGGSKCGVMDTALLEKYTGKRYYNFSFTDGNFCDYLRYSQFLMENTDISEIMLHISCFEVMDYSKDDTSADNYKVPGVVTGDPFHRFTEYLSYLMTDVNTTLKAIKDRDKTEPSVDDLQTGVRSWQVAEKAMAEDPDAFVEKNLTKRLPRDLKALFDQRAATYPAYDDNIAALKEIKALCEQNGVTLRVVIGASFLGERNTYECYRFYSYLRQIVDITEVWDFSDFNDVNRNPYNFVNRTHYKKEVADLMIHTMFGGPSKEGFGIYLTKENIDDYLEKRVSDYQKLEQEYRSTGTVLLDGPDGSGYIPAA